MTCEHPMNLRQGIVQANGYSTWCRGCGALGHGHLENASIDWRLPDPPERPWPEGPPTRWDDQTSEGLRNMIVDLRNRLAICRVATLQEAMGIADGLAAHNTTGALRELIRREARTIKRDA